MAVSKSSTIPFSCHCGAIKVEVPREPAAPFINECMCSICRRYGAAWVYYTVNAVKITKNGPVKLYSWGDNGLAFTWCDKCGCLVYWYPIGADPLTSTKEIGINSRCVNNMDDLKYVERRITWDIKAVTKEGIYDENGPVRNDAI